MAREILFKAKRIDNGEWVEGSFITGVFCRLGQDIPYIFCPEKADYDCFEDFSETNGIFEVQSETICQYTGLTDKNGKKIFDNDIFKHYNRTDFLDFESYETGVVKWDEIKCRYVNYRVGTNEIFNLNCECDYEVICNIFDNLELLEG